MKALHTGGGEAMDRYIAEMDEANRIAAVWVMKKTARGPSVFDPRKHIFDPRQPAEFSGAAQNEIVTWLDTAKRRG
jgi:hypothetical protein